MRNEPQNSVDAGDQPRPAHVMRRAIIFLTLAAAVGFLYFGFRDQFTIETLAQQESQWRAFQQSRPLLVVGAAFCLYVLVTSLSIPGATPLSLAIAWLLGFWQALLIVSFASTTGATLAFLLSRYLLGDWVQRRFAQQWKKFSAAWERDGAFYLFALRLIPVVPFFLINLLMGLTPIRARTFWWVSQIGMLPGTCLYLWFGASLPSLDKLSQDGIDSLINWKILAALGALGLFPLIVKKVLPKSRS